MAVPLVIGQAWALTSPERWIGREVISERAVVDRAHEDGYQRRRPHRSEALELSLRVIR